MLAVFGEGDSADESRVRRHRPDTLLQRQVPKPNLAVAGSRRQCGQVGGMFGHALHAVSVTGQPTYERFGEHFVHFGGVERALIFSGAFERMQFRVVIARHFMKVLFRLSNVVIGIPTQHFDFEFVGRHFFKCWVLASKF